jgi:FkbM family methyltransferase
MLFFDIGANIGAWTVRNVNHHNSIVAVEPSPTAFSVLKHNMNNLPSVLSDNVILLNYAISSEPVIDFYECKKHRYSTTNKDWITDKKSRFYGKEFSVIKCKAKTLDSLLTLYGMPDLIKIDVEGGEYQVLKTLTQKVPQVCFEWAQEFADITHKCICYLFNLGFKYFYVQFEDIYDFRPSEDEYIKVSSIEQVDVEAIIKHFAKYEPKRRLDWGMIWCK